MDTKTIIIIVVAALLFILIVAVIFIRNSNHKRFKRLQENLNKYKLENENLDNDNKITLSKDYAVNSTIEDHIQQPTEEHTNHSEPIIEDYVVDEPAKTFQDDMRQQTKNVRRNFYTQKKFSSETKLDSASANMVNDDFEEFMNEHSFTRKILDGDVMQKLKNLPPEVKALILSNVFNKHED